MIKSSNDKSVAPVVGILLLISIFFLFMAQYQTVQIPEEKEDIEINHHQTVNAQLEKLANTIITSSDTGEESIVEVDMGTEYSFDIFLSSIFEALHIDPTGNMRVNSFVDQVKIYNAEAIGSAEGFWRGSSNPCDGPRDHCFETASFRYVANYQAYKEDSIKYYENQMLFEIYQNNETSSSAIISTGKDILNKNNINLQALSGSFSLTQKHTEGFKVDPVSSSTNTITIQGNSSEDSDGNITYQDIRIDIPTRLNEESWRGGIINMNNSNLVKLEYNNNSISNNVSLFLRGNNTYQLSLSKIHLTPVSNTNPHDKPEAAYISWSESDEVDIRENSLKTISAQVRDRFNNPVSNVGVRASAFDSNGECYGDFQTSSQICNGYNQPGVRISNSKGNVNFQYKAPRTQRDVSITIELEVKD